MCYEVVVARELRRVIATDSFVEIGGACVAEPATSITL